MWLLLTLAVIGLPLVLWPASTVGSTVVQSICVKNLRNWCTVHLDVTGDWTTATFCDRTPITAHVFEIARSSETQISDLIKACAKLVSEGAYCDKFPQPQTMTFWSLFKSGDTYYGRYMDVGRDTLVFKDLRLIPFEENGGAFTKEEWQARFCQ